MFSKEEAFAEIEAAMNQYNEVFGSEFGLYFDKDYETIKVEQYGEWDDETETAGIEQVSFFKLIGEV